jgi:thiol-disulfide isomerase/thioredoxin
MPLILLLYFVWLLLPFQICAQTPDINISINLRGVYDSKVSLLALTGAGSFKPAKELRNVKTGETATLFVPIELLPGEFVLRFDYKENESSSPYPSEKYIFINDQDLELWVNPKYCNNPDSTNFQEGERENGAFERFSMENSKQKEKLGLLQNFLMNYDDTGSKFYREGIREYESRRTAYNNWLKKQSQHDISLFVSNLYGFQYIPEISWTGIESDRVGSLIDHYFDGIDFNNPLILKTSGINKCMDTYVNLYGQQCNTITIRDSLLPLAGKKAIEKARQGHPLVYGWMVDYFYRGFEANNIPAGMKILQPYLDDPVCLTSKRQEIAKRLKGIETLTTGSRAPDIIMIDPIGNPFELYQTETYAKYILLYFWSADCSHCVETADVLYPWQQQPEISQKINVIAISFDDTDTEVKAWEKIMPALKGWKHLRADAGINSKTAADYFILATPVMVLIDAKSKVIVALPSTVNELMTAIQ